MNLLRTNIQGCSFLIFFFSFLIKWRNLRFNFGWSDKHLIFVDICRSVWNGCSCIPTVPNAQYLRDLQRKIISEEQITLTFPSEYFILIKSSSVFVSLLSKMHLFSKIPWVWYFFPHVSFHKPGMVCSSSHSWHNLLPATSKKLQSWKNLLIWIMPILLQCS